MKKVIAYIDILGSKNSLLGDNPAQGIQKIEQLIQIISDQLSQTPVLTACNFSDSFVIYGEEKNLWILKSVIGNVFRSYYKLNKQRSSFNINDAFLLRGGLGVGDIHEISKMESNFRAFYGTGTGLISAYQVSEISRGHRIFLDNSFLEARRGLYPPKGSPVTTKTVKPFVEVNADFSELAWYDTTEIMDFINIARQLLGNAMDQYGQAESDSIIKHYTLTLAQLLTCCRDIPTLINFTRYHLNRDDCHNYVWPVWCSAWVSLLHQKLRSDLPKFQQIIWASFVNSCRKTRFSGEIFEYLKKNSVFHLFLTFLYKGKFEASFMNLLEDDESYQARMAEIFQRSKQSTTEKEPE